ncbi:LLM class flavin-dependent oxidoreductase [Lentzea sp. DG1S-22]|uniref:LLM class flavin-dependent oxidoreductase n=1 Tax=Lentzea sp. DG1S-22 TaxID=3108822 RepID=UPI002E76D71F|nr:LLM class flavin-dependent oxidoreductase [Lentzea sp. DG1S-22]WVH80908.1 LLM class flavin-dependent oxidoreductase [Lentzea sp. DG1S-22]
MTTLGVVYRPQLPPENLRSVVLAAEESGVDSLWLWEDCFLESGIACASAALAWTSRLKVGVGLLPVPLRNVAITAMEAATLDRLFPGRVTIGVGHGVQDWMGQVGARVASPLTLLHEYTNALKALLAGERVTADGRYVKLTGVALDWPPAAPMPVYVGGHGMKTLVLAGEIGDGTILDASTGLERVRAIRATRDHPVVVYVETDSRDAAFVTDLVSQVAAAGATSVILQQSATSEDPEGFVRFVGSLDGVRA